MIPAPIVDEYEKSIRRYTTATQEVKRCVREQDTESLKKASQEANDAYLNWKRMNEITAQFEQAS